MEKRYISPQELSEYLGFKIDTIYSWVWKREIPYRKMGRCIRFDLREIDKWAEERRVAELH